MDSHLADLSRSIDPAELGRRIRVARVAAGMTQSQVTAGEVTPAYLSRIEDGQRRPDATLLERMATRMGTTLHQLLTGITTHEARDLELQIEHAAIALALGDPQQAHAMATSVTRRLETYGDEALLANARRVQAEAHRATGNLDEAIGILEELVADSTPDMNTLRALIMLCRSYGERDEIAKAIATGHIASRMIIRLGIEGLTEALQLAAAVADVHYRRGDLHLAAAMCRSALDSTTHQTLSTSQAAAYWHASTCESSANGATPAAIELAKVALTLVDLGEGRSSLERVLARIATAQRAASRPPAGQG